MKFPYSLSLLWVAVQAKPIVELVRGTTAAANADPGTELLVREGIKLSRDLDGRGLQKRVEAAFPLDRSWNNEVLFGGSWNEHHPEDPSDAALQVTCIECYTRGTVSAKLTASGEDIFHPTLRLGFSGVQAYANLGVTVNTAQTFSLNLFSSDSPIGIGITGLDVGVVFFVDLVFSVSDAIDLTAGFMVAVPDDAYLEADILEGDIGDSTFDGLNTQALPVTVTSGTATFKADLRLRVQAGAEATLPFFNIGAGAVVGIYANLIEFVAVIDSTPECPLETEIWWDLNVGAYANLDVVVDYTTLGPVPTISTTLLTAPTLSSCHTDVGTPTTTPIETLPVPSTSSVSVPAPTSESSLPVPSPSETGGEESSYTSSSSSSVITSAPVTETPVIPTSSLSSISSSVSVPADSSSSSYEYSSSSSIASSSSSGYYYPVYPTDSYPTYPTASYPESSASTSAPGYSYTSAPEYSGSAPAGPTYTSTYTHTLTMCGYPGIMNCPPSYQTQVTVTRTTTYCPASSTAIATVTHNPTVIAPVPSSGAVAYPTGEASVPAPAPAPAVTVTLTRLPSPVTHTFFEPEQTSVRHNEHTPKPTATKTKSISAIHSVTPTVLPTQGHGNGNAHGNGTAIVPGPVPTQSGNANIPTAAAGRVFSSFGACFATAVLVVAGVLVL